MKKKLLRPESVADLLDVPKDRIYKLAQSGLIPAIRVGRTWRFDAVKLAEWMDSGGAGGWKLRANSGNETPEDMTQVATV
jgi:excisionase family DNA binding protein